MDETKIELDKNKIEALKAIKNSNLLIKLIAEYVQSNPQNALELLNELGQNLESLGGVDLSKVEMLKGEDGKTPIFGEDYMTGEEIDGLEAYIRDNTESISAGLAEKLTIAITSIQKQIDNAILELRDGKDGKDGRDVTKEDIEEVLLRYKEELRGSPDSPFDIIEKIKQVRGTKRLELRNIQGLPEIKQRVEQNTEDIEDLKENINKELEIAVSRRDGGGTGTDVTAIHNNVANEISAITEKLLPVSADLILIEDSAGSFVKKKVQIGNLPSGSGDVVGPSSAVNNNIAVFDATTGKLIKDGGNTIAQVLDRANHTGTQASTTITGLATVATSGLYSDLTGTPDLSVYDELDQYADLASFPVTGNSAKFYLAQDTGIMYRWAGSAYVVISGQLALGETSSTAYRGDRGKTAYDHVSSTGTDHSYINQSVKTTDSPSFVNATLSGKTAGRIPFFGTGGVISENANFIFDSTNYRLGIGTNGVAPTASIQGIGTGGFNAFDWTFNTASNSQLINLTQTSAGGVGTAPYALIKVSNAGSNPYFNFGDILVLMKDGNLGVGTTTPADKLHVYGGNMLIDNKTNTDTYLLTGLQTSTGNNKAFGLRSDSNGQGVLELYMAGTKAIQLAGWSGNYSYINAGNFGLGTATPSDKLHIDGNNVFCRLDSAVAGLHGITLTSGGTQVGVLDSNYSSGQIRVGGMFSSSYLSLMAGGSERVMISASTGLMTAYGGIVTSDHGTASSAQVVNVCYGTSATPPTASTTTEGAFYVRYAA